MSAKDLRVHMEPLWPFGTLPSGGLSLEQVNEALVMEEAVDETVEIARSPKQTSLYPRLARGITAFTVTASCIRSQDVMTATLVALEKKMQNEPFSPGLTKLLLALHRMLLTLKIPVENIKEPFEHPSLRLYALQVARREEEESALQASRLQRLRALITVMDAELQQEDERRARQPITIDFASQVSDGNAFCLSQAVCEGCGRSILRGDNTGLKAALGRQRFEAVNKALSAIRVDHVHNGIRHRECCSANAVTL